VIAVAHHQPPNVLVDLISVRGNVDRNLGLQRRGAHRPRPAADDLVQ
jgi:hypothetical protein